MAGRIEGLFFRTATCFAFFHYRSNDLHWELKRTPNSLILFLEIWLLYCVCPFFQKKKKCLRLVYVIYSPFKLDYSLSHCYYFHQMLVQKEKLIIIFVGRFIPLLQSQPCQVPSARALVLAGLLLCLFSSPTPTPFLS